MFLAYLLLSHLICHHWISLHRALLFAVFGQLLSHLICHHWISLHRALLFTVFGQLLSHQICHHWISIHRALLFAVFGQLLSHLICHHWIILHRALLFDVFGQLLSHQICHHGKSFLNFLVIFHDETSSLFHSNIQSWQMCSLPILDPYVFLSCNSELNHFLFNYRPNLVFCYANKSLCPKTSRTML